MWKELLLELAKENPYSNPNPPASLDSIKDAEDRLDIKFPEELIQCLLEADGDGDALFSVQRIIDINILMNELSSTNNFLRVMTNGCGDDFGYQVINKEIPVTSIFMWDHELNEFSLIASNLKEIVIKFYHDDI
jgi:cell wall assembly regulator SMI1